ncbi:Dolichyl-diphosphooligosaccharide--protein glycosyltransferase subunit DAD1 [Sesamum angolense]|uniref:Dolichyl-diphosphooligosaccharide--protein glycosyltransferase subunit DAD1 n=1 Tax=Sesamum angolense TaxID=2727404 RepID=A0AAE1WVN7_9LAMI|nr:Dolichyl-diphosphooligosaccharide--protein glycosyltransferase subunit DAD1 [Sesamum angolense]
MGRSATTKDAQALFHSLRSAYAATPNNLKIIDLYIVFAVVTAVIQAYGNVGIGCVQASWLNQEKIMGRLVLVGKVASLVRLGRGLSTFDPMVYEFDSTKSLMATRRADRVLLVKRSWREKVGLHMLEVVYMAIVGSFPFNSFLSGVLSCVGTAVLAVSLRIQVNKENKEFKDLPPERAFADFVLCNLVLHLVIMNFLG